MFTITTRTARNLGLGAVAIAALSAQPAVAQSAELGVSAQVVESCTIATSPITFGSIDVNAVTPHDQTGSFTVTCTIGTTWTADADAGENSSSVTARKMAKGATDRLNYRVSTDALHATNFAQVIGVATSLPIVTTLYGQVPAGQTGVPVGSYTDAVTITLTL